MKTDARLFDGLYDGLERALDLRRTQHTLVAANLANADTPDYLAREVPFAEMLADEVQRAEVGEPPGPIDVTELEPEDGSLDGNSVNAEREAVKLTENALMFNALVEGTSRRLAILRFAASDGKA